MDPSEARPLSEQIACVKREIALRRSVYPKFVASGRFKQATADTEIARMEAVLDTLEHLASAGEPTQSHLVINALAAWIAVAEDNLPSGADWFALHDLKAKAKELGFVWP